MMEKAMASGMSANATTSPANMSGRMLLHHSLRNCEKENVFKKVLERNRSL
jgi:hypothetical protein